MPRKVSSISAMATTKSDHNATAIEKLPADRMRFRLQKRERETGRYSALQRNGNLHLVELAPDKRQVLDCAENTRMATTGAEIGCPSTGGDTSAPAILRHGGVAPDRPLPSCERLFNQ